METTKLFPKFFKSPYSFLSIDIYTDDIEIQLFCRKIFGYYSKYILLLPFFDYMARFNFIYLFRL